MHAFRYLAKITLRALEAICSDEKKSSQGTARTGWALQAMILAFAPWMLICLSLPATRDVWNSRFVDDSVAMVTPYDLSTVAGDTYSRTYDFRCGWIYQYRSSHRKGLKDGDGQVSLNVPYSFRREKSRLACSKSHTIPIKSSVTSPQHAIRKENTIYAQSLREIEFVTEQASPSASSQHKSRETDHKTPNAIESPPKAKFPNTQ